MTVGQHTEAGGARLFVLRVQAYAGEGVTGDVNNRYTAFHVVVHIPATPRYTKTNIPRPGRWMMVSGHFVGFYPFEGKESICLQLTDISFLPFTTTPELPPTNRATTSGRKRPRTLGGSSSPRKAVPVAVPAPMQNPDTECK
jgi:hypothetical protein